MHGGHVQLFHKVLAAVGSSGGHCGGRSASRFEHPIGAREGLLAVDDRGDLVGEEGPSGVNGARDGVAGCGLTLAESRDVGHDGSEKLADRGAGGCGRHDEGKDDKKGGYPKEGPHLAKAPGGICGADCASVAITPRLKLSWNCDEARNPAFNTLFIASRPGAPQKECGAVQRSQFLDNLPVEDWAAGAASVVRRLRRRAVRRPGAVLLLVGLATAGVAIQANALLWQDSAHPAPFWGEAIEPAMAVSGGEPAEADAARSELVAQIQDALVSEARPTGVLDDTTQARIRAFERERGLPETGEPSLALVAALDARRDAQPRRVASPRPAADRVDVEALQTLLNARGYGPLIVDGLWGPKTRAALEAFAQSPNGRAELGPEVLALLSGGA